LNLYCFLLFPDTADFLTIFFEEFRNFNRCAADNDNKVDGNAKKGKTDHIPAILVLFELINSKIHKQLVCTKHDTAFVEYFKSIHVRMLEGFYQDDINDYQQTYE